MQFLINTTVKNENVTIVSVEGEVDVFTAPQLKKAILNCLGIDVSQPQIVVNLTDVGYLDAAGLNVLVGGLKRCRQNAGELSVVCPNPRIKRLFEITKLDEIFKIFSEVEEALQTVGSSQQVLITA